MLKGTALRRLAERGAPLGGVYSAALGNAEWHFSDAEWHLVNVEWHFSGVKVPLCGHGCPMLMLRLCLSTVI